MKRVVYRQSMLYTLGDDSQKTVKKERRNMNSRKETKDLHFKVSVEDYNIFKERAKKRKLDHTSYFRYLVREDKDDFQCQGAADAINKISAATAGLLENCDKCPCQDREECMIHPFIINISEGVESLWRYFR